MTPEKITLGHFEIYGLREGFFSLDGGAMFGVVPKTLWEKKYPADPQNRIRLGLNSILIKTPEARVLVDTGIGSVLDKKYSAYYKIECDPGLVGALENIGVRAEDIGYVINTHLHFDHCGGNTVVNKNGEIMPTFSNAKYIIQRGEWDNARNPCSRDKPSYLPQSFLPLESSDHLHLIEGDQEIISGVDVVVTPGHTAFHQCARVHAEDQTVFFLGDTVPTSAHVGLSYIMSYDLYPLLTLRNKEKIYETAIKEDWIVAFNHDPDCCFGKIGEKDGKYIFLPIL